MGRPSGPISTAAGIASVGSVSVSPAEPREPQAAVTMAMIKINNRPSFPMEFRFLHSERKPSTTETIVIREEEFA